MRIIDSFLKDKNQLSDEDYNRSRLLIIVLLSLISISFLLYILSLFGMFSGITNLLIFLVLSANLFFLKKRGNLDITFLITTVLCTTLMIFNTINDGYILSFNNKWFIIAIITIFFMKPKWLTTYAIFLLGLQTFYFYAASQANQDPSMSGAILEEYIDNLIFFGLCYGLLRLLNKYQKRQNERILESNRLLEVRTSQLLESNGELEKFALLVSHDLKTPLRNVVSFTTLLEREIKNPTGANVLEYTKFIKDGSLKLNNLVNDILSYSRLESTSKKEEEINLNKLVSEIKESISTYIKKRNAKVVIENQLPIVLSQKSMMIQLLKNLIENGLKYNESNAPTVTVKYTTEDGKNCLIIMDNGIGIKEEYHHSIFEMFTRLHGENQYEGSGIGLSTCHKIVTKIGGSINVSSNAGEGTTFEIQFPKSAIIEQNKIPKEILTLAN